MKKQLLPGLFVFILLLAFSPVYAAPPANPTASYTMQDLVTREEQAIQLIRDQKFAEAYALLQPLYPQFSDSDTLNFLLGQCAANLQKNKEAIAYYEKISPQNPAYLRVRLELGRAYAVAGETKLAKKEFNAVLAATPPPVVAENIRTFLALLDAHKLVNIRTTFGYIHDSNVNAGPDDIITHGNWTIDMRGKSDSGASLELNLDVINPYAANQSWQNNLSYRNTSYFSLHSSSWQEISLKTGPVFRNKAGAFAWPLTAQTTYIGEREYNRAYGISPQWQIQTNQNRQLLLSASLLKQEYPTNPERSGSSWSLDIADRSFLKPGKSGDYIEIGAGYAKNITGAAVYNNEIWSGHLSYYRQFNRNCWALLQNSYAKTSYQGVDTYALWVLNSTDSRQNKLNGWKATFGLTKNPWNYALSYTLNRVNSNIDIYAYDRALVQLQATKMF